MEDQQIPLESYASNWMENIFPFLRDKFLLGGVSSRLELATLSSTNVPGPDVFDLINFGSFSEMATPERATKHLTVEPQTNTPA